MTIILTFIFGAKTPYHGDVSLYNMSLSLMNLQNMYIKHFPFFQQLSLKSPLEARLGVRLSGQRLGGNEVRLKDARLYLPSFFPFS